MASIGATLAGLKARYIQPTPEEVHSEKHLRHIHCELELDGPPILSPFQEITGKVTVSNAKEISCQCIFVQLTANVELNMTVRLDRQLTSNCRRLAGLIPSSETTQGGEIVLSPVREVLVNEWDSSYTVQIPPGSHVFPFRLSMPLVTLPAPFKSRSGHLQFKIEVLMETLCCFVSTAEKILIFSGYRNLNALPNCNISEAKDASLYASFFSTRPLISTTFIVNRTGFLPGENVSFSLTLSNPQQCLVKKVTCLLIQRATYSATGGKKVSSAVLDTFEDNGHGHGNEVQMNWVERLRIPRKCVPSYSSLIYSLQHLVQYSIEIDEHSSPLKREVEIVVGTTRAPDEEVDQAIVVRNHLDKGDGNSNPGRERSSSVVSNASEVTMISLPPAYSQLASTTTGSTRSLETLPPAYDDICKK